MFRLRYLVNLLATFITRFKGILFFGVLVGFLIFIILRFAFPLLSSTQGEVIGLSGRYTADTLPKSILSLIGQGLTVVNDQGEVEPALAKEWLSEDQGKIWVFTLADNVFWHDGTKVSSKDLNYTFEDVEIETPDAKTIVFKLKTPFAPFTSVAAKPVFKRGLLGTGNWKVKRISLSGEYVEKLEIATENGQKKTFHFYPTENSLKTAFKLGEVDILDNLISPLPFDEWSTVKVSENVNYGQVVAIFFNNNSNLFKENKNLRQALAYAIDKDALGMRALSPISPDSWAYNPQVKKYDYSLERAKELLDESSVKLIGDIGITIETTSVLLPTAEKIVKFWSQLGVVAKVRVVNELDPNFDAFLAIFEIPKDPDQYATWHSSQTATNVSRFQSPRIDKLLEDGRLELNKERRREIYLDFQRFLLEDLPAIFLYHPVYYEVRRK